MTRWLPALAAGAFLALVLLVAVMALAPRTPPSVTERTDRLAAELRCPDCQGLSVADSPTDSARAIRQQIDELLAAGATDADVRAHFVDRYGQWILLAPSAPAVWLLPLVMVAIAAAGLVAWLARGQRRAPVTRRPGAAERRRVHEEAEALDA
jgi:cytochrome c-type biogenesis protein CcmH